MTQQRHAYLIGANGPQQTQITPLQYAEQDVQRLKQAFDEHPCNFVRAKSVIADSSISVLEDLEEFAEVCQDNDLLIVHFSGHAKSEKRELYLIKNNTVFQQNGRLRFSTTINISDIKRILDGCRARHKLLILDCCYSGTALAGGAFRANDEITESLEQLKGSTNAILTAGSYREEARELGTLKGGFLSSVIARACTNYFSAVATENALSLTDIWNWLESTELNRVNKTLPQREQIPRPHLLNDRVAGGDNEIWFTDKRRISSTSQEEFLEQACHGVSIQGLDDKKVKEYVQEYARERQWDIAPDSLKDIPYLCKRFNLTWSQDIPRRSSVLAFHPTPSLYLPSALVRVTMRGLSGEEPYPRKVIDAPLSEQAKLTINWLKTNLNTISENVGSGQRIDRCEIPERALRELIVNAIVHRDYKAQECVQVEITPQQVIITNPGRLDAEIERSEPPFSYRVSHPKNPVLLNIMVTLRWAEGTVQGFRYISEDFEKYNLPLPTLCNLPNGLVQVIIQRPNLHTISYGNYSPRVLSATNPIDSQLPAQPLSQDQLHIFGQPSGPTQLLEELPPKHITTPAESSPSPEPVKPDRGFVGKIRSQWNRQPLGIKILTTVLILSLVLSSTLLSVFNLFMVNQQSTGSVIPTPPPFTDGIGIFKAPNGDTIGISDGRFPFDTSPSSERPDGVYKTDAAKALQQGNTSAALALWQTAIDQDPGDGETYIYLENQQMLNSGNPYINIVLGVAMAGDPRFISRDVLQGAYIAQQEYNQTHDVKVRLLIASAGSNPLYANTVAQQIVQLARIDSHTIAVLGWANSSRTFNAEPILVKTPLVMLSQSASSSLLTNLSPYFFHIVPSDNVQAGAGALYARRTLGAQNVVTFVDHADAYSQDLASSFASQFTAMGGRIIATETYKAEQTKNFQPLLDNALISNPDLIYFAGNPADISTFVTTLPTTGKFAALRVMTGDGGAGVVSVKPIPSGYNRLVYTAFADPDAWKIAGIDRPPFMDEYSNTFSGNNRYTGDGYTRPDAFSILSYDGMLTLLTASQTALQGGKTTIIPNDLRQALTHITGTQSIQGVSGQITFAPNHDPIKKPVFIVEIKDGTSHIVPNGIQGGCYIKGCV